MVYPEGRPLDVWKALQLSEFFRNRDTGFRSSNCDVLNDHSVVFVDASWMHDMNGYNYDTLRAIDDVQIRTL